ncbi:Rad4 transglutaminase-like domain-containing protein [Cladorrhinum sp. PSN259]|nr:Rad4 transglutaminase-like domain-containing protein [Cladorrhinum sp. PSN259]
MPPYVPGKRLRDATTPSPPSKQAIKVPPRKSTLFDDLDALSTPRSFTKNGSSMRQIDDSEDDESSLTSLSDGDFEEVPATKRQKVEDEVAGSDDDEDEDIEFEDVETPHTVYTEAPMPTGNLELTLIRDTRISLANALGKKGPSKLERKIRIATHCVHVQLLLWHNALRNSWLCDPLVQGIMLSHVPPRLMDEVDRWRKNSGLEFQQETVRTNPKTKVEPKGRGKGKDKAVAGREWGGAAQHLEKGAVDMSHGDPLFRLMKVLSSWWKQRFRVTAPGLRKWGYMTLERLDRLTKAFKEQRDYDQDLYGEQIKDLDEFRQCAEECSGSRDVGAQLFTALLRALGLEARLIANLQTLGFGWNKLEEADPEKEINSNQTPVEGTKRTAAVKPMRRSKAAPKTTNPKAPARPTRRSAAKPETAAEEDLEFDDADSDDELVIEVPPSPPRREKTKLYDTDLEFPHYWTEVLSPVTNKYLTVDPIVKSVIGTNRELVESLEPRGGKADKAKQMIAYAVAYSQDGTAKEVTVRYLKRQVLPGRTKGNRIPIEKVPVYNRQGKVKRYDQFDWFKSAMKGYVRGDRNHPLTEIDEMEDSTDLKPAKAETKEVKEGEETLQHYKQSKEFVLERHLKREEALVPDAQPVKMFKMKGAKGAAASAAEEPVYSRKDVVQVKSAETWHKQGRAPIPGEQPLKRVPYRAATTNRRREIAEAEAATGEKVLQGLYSFDQTEWIIPPPIRNGIIPKNEYGNIDLFVEHMCPKGAVHVPYRGAMRVAKRLGIDYAEAVVDFEFGHRMAVPVIQGVVVAAEYHDQVMEELAKDEAEKARKADEKRRKAALGLWRKFIMGMRIVERIKAEYGDVEEGGVDVFEKGGSQQNNGDVEMGDADDGLGGGFLPEGYQEEEEDGDEERQLTSGFFSVVDEHHDDEDEDRVHDDDILEVDHGEVEEAVGEEPEPVHKGKSVMSTKPKRKAAAKKTAASSRRRRRRRNEPSSSEEEEEEEESEEFDE